MPPQDILLDGLNDEQRAVVRAGHRRVLVVAGAGSGKTEVMARRVAWWVAVEGASKDTIVAFTFTERAAEEMKFRIREKIQAVTGAEEDVTLGGMYVGTIHGFCLKSLRELSPDEYHNYDILDDAGRLALIQRGYNNILGLRGLQAAFRTGQSATMSRFAQAYDLLNEYNQLDVQLPNDAPPPDLRAEQDWCRAAVLQTPVGAGPEAAAFATSAARFYAYLRCRRFLDFSTSQTELIRLLRRPEALARARAMATHIVVDEVQDLNPVQDRLVRTLAGETGRLTAVGDHRQAIYRFRGSRVDLMGTLWAELSQAGADTAVFDLKMNYRSTPRIIEVANRWARTITPPAGMDNPDMDHARLRRTDGDPSHVATVQFQNRDAEAEWIAQAVQRLVDTGNNTGAAHDTQDAERGLALSDIAILVRSSTDARTYMRALEAVGIPAVFRAGPDLFAQPEVMLFIACLARAVGVDQFLGGPKPSSFPNRIRAVLRCNPVPDEVIQSACTALRQAGLNLPADTEARLLVATDLVKKRLVSGDVVVGAEAAGLRASALVKWLRQGGRVRRVFPQQLLQFFLGEAQASLWDIGVPRARSAMFHLGQLSTLVKGVETPGWNDPTDFKYQVIALCLWGSEQARTEEAPLLVPVDAVTIGTIHGAKGLEYSAVFLADVVSLRFPSNYARRQDALPFDGPFLQIINPAALADNANYDDERRLMYVAVTRAERFLFVTTSGRRPSQFFREISGMVNAAGGLAISAPDAAPAHVRLLPTAYRRDLRLVTSFSDLRYYLECPHDFYLRKVLGFAPTIDQAFGYGRGVHNLMRAIHSNPQEWAAIASDRAALEGKVRGLIDQGLFYLRYTIGEPLDNMKAKAVRIVSDYVRKYVNELAVLKFEPEREFETLLEEEQVLISGAIDVIRLDDPPRVTLIDFKSGDVESDTSTRLDADEMRLQVTLYGLAAKHELEYDPERGLVRYLDEPDPAKAEIYVDLGEDQLTTARRVVAEVARKIRDRRFDEGPISQPRDPTLQSRCAECDFKEFCGRELADVFRARRRAAP